MQPPGRQDRSLHQDPPQAEHQWVHDQRAAGQGTRADGNRQSSHREAPRGRELEADKATAEKRLAVTEELKDHQDRLTWDTAALIVAVRETREGLWEAGSGLAEVAWSNIKRVCICLKHFLSLFNSDFADSMPIIAKTTVWLVIK